MDSGEKAAGDIRRSSPEFSVSVSPPTLNRPTGRHSQTPVSPENVEHTASPRSSPVESPFHCRQSALEPVADRPTSIWNERPTSFSSTVVSSPGCDGASPVELISSPAPSTGDSYSVSNYPNVGQLWGFPASLSRCPVGDKSRARTPESVIGQSLAGLQQPRGLSSSFQNCHGRSLAYDSATSAVAAAAAARAAMFYNQMAFQQQLQLLQQRQRELFEAGSKHRLQSSTTEDASAINWLSAMRLPPQTLPPGVATDVGLGRALDKEAVER